MHSRHSHFPSTLSAHLPEGGNHLSPRRKIRSFHQLSSFLPSDTDNHRHICKGLTARQGEGRKKKYVPPESNGKETLLQGDLRLRPRDTDPDQLLCWKTGLRKVHNGYKYEARVRTLPGVFQVSGLARPTLPAHSFIPNA